MDNLELSVLIENELYRYILALSEDRMDRVTEERIQEGIIWFLLKYEDKIDKNQRRFIIDKISKMFENKNKHITSEKNKTTKEQFDRIEDMEL